MEPRLLHVALLGLALITLAILLHGCTKCEVRPDGTRSATVIGNGYCTMPIPPQLPTLRSGTGDAPPVQTPQVPVTAPNTLIAVGDPGSWNGLWSILTMLAGLGVGLAA